MATQSYTIYIRYPNQVSNNNCKPRPSEEVNNTKPINIPSGGGSSSGDSGGSSGSGFSIGGVVKAIKNPLGSLLGSASKAAPAIAGIMAAIKVADQLVETALPYYEGYTGDYRPSFNYANAKAAIGVIMNPLGAINNTFTRQMEVYRQNLKIEQSRMLTGNSIINTYGGKASN
jgi:hypothetical protein